MSKFVAEDLKSSLLLSTLVDGNLDQCVIELMLAAYLNALTMT